MILLACEVFLPYVLTTRASSSRSRKGTCTGTGIVGLYWTDVHSTREIPLKSWPVIPRLIFDWLCSALLSIYLEYLWSPLSTQRTLFRTNYTTLIVLVMSHTRYNVSCGSVLREENPNGEYITVHHIFEATLFRYFSNTQSQSV
jgi:hypothetical protein